VLNTQGGICGWVFGTIFDTTSSMRREVVVAVNAP
jgi:hypothetical protein